MAGKLAGRIFNTVVFISIGATALVCFKACNEPPTPADIKKLEEIRVSKREETKKYMDYCRSECPVGTKPLVLKGGSGQYGNDWVCACADTTTIYTEK